MLGRHHAEIGANNSDDFDFVADRQLTAWCREDGLGIGVESVAIAGHLKVRAGARDGC